jgi:hypothetical protein
MGILPYTALAVKFYFSGEKRPIVSWNTLLNHQISLRVTSSVHNNEKKNKTFQLFPFLNRGRDSENYFARE